MLNFITCTQTLVSARMSLNMVHSILHLMTLAFVFSMNNHEEVVEEEEREEKREWSMGSTR